MVVNGHSQLEMPLSDSSCNPAPCDWSRIVAVEVDEPYHPIDGDLTTGNCTTPTDPLLDQINTDLYNRSVDLAALNPKARFWVNLHLNEANWIQSCYFQFGIVTLPVFNKKYFDVISTDWYGQHWVQHTTIQGFYEVVAQNRATAHQQVALIPGVYSSGVYGSQEPYLQEYFNYAESANQTTCNLPLGSQGITGIYDGCPVWVVMGYLSGNGDGAGDIGLFSTGSKSIRSIWEKEVALNPVTPTQKARAKVIPPILQLLLQ